VELAVDVLSVAGVQQNAKAATASPSASAYFRLKHVTWHRCQLWMFSELAMSSSFRPAHYPKSAECPTASPPAIKAYQTEPVAMPSVPELSPSSINTDVRRRGFNPFFTGVTVGIIAAVMGFLIVLAYLVMYYLRYIDG
jgi:hypothetical protein